jgi:hypothetical protein
LLVYTPAQYEGDSLTIKDLSPRDLICAKEGTAAETLVSLKKTLQVWTFSSEGLKPDFWISMTKSWNSLQVPKVALRCGLILVLVSVLFSPFPVIAQSDDFILRAEQKWDTYGCGGTCIPGTHDLAIADVDGDGMREIITGGFSYSMTNNTRSKLEAPLRIMSWDGRKLTLEKSENWLGNIGVVYAADADGDGAIEILTSGSVTYGNGSASAVKFWNWDGSKLTLRGTYINISAASVFVADFNNDDKPEIAMVRRSQNASQTGARLSVWNWDGNNMNLLNETTWPQDQNAQANSVYAEDLDRDGTTEIVTAGYNNGLKNSSGQLCIWHWDQNGLKLRTNKEWQLVEGIFAEDVAGNPMGNTIISNVKTADVDADGVSEIITGGFTYDGEKVNAQLRIWNWTGDTILLETSREWSTYDITELKSITVNDVDNDGQTEIVTSGVTAGKDAFSENATIKELAQLRVWSWNGATLILEQARDWIVDDGVSAWQDGTGDLDNDGKVEIVTVGCSYLDTLCDPNLRIWSLPATPKNENEGLRLPTIYLIAATVASASVVAITVLIVRNKRGKT